MGRGTGTPQAREEQEMAQDAGQGWVKLCGWEIARGVSAMQAVKKVPTPNAVFSPRSRPQSQAAELVAG